MTAGDVWKLWSEMRIWWEIKLKREDVGMVAATGGASGCCTSACLCGSAWPFIVCVVSLRPADIVNNSLRG